MAGACSNWTFEHPEGLSQSDQAVITECRSLRPDSYCQIGLTLPGFLNCPIANQILFWSPEELPSGDSISISSSRMGQKLDLRSAWFDALRTIAIRISNESKFLITAEGTSTNDFVQRVGQIFRIPTVIFEPIPSQRLADWYHEIETRRRNSGVVQSGGAPRKSDAGFRAPCRIYYRWLENAPASRARDHLLINVAQTSILLSVRTGGNIEHAANLRLKHHDNPPTRLLINRTLTPKPVESSLLERGATAWLIYHPDRDQVENSSASTSRSRTAKLSLDELSTENKYLIHCTRRRVGPWPNQTNAEFIDDLIFQSHQQDHRAVASLRRILALKRIFASNDLTRDRRPVVCFSNVPLAQITERRVFRPHLSRWDFEPFGLAIDREYLQKRGARPVVYGTEQDWKQLPEESRTFFQMEKSKSGNIDWQQEREWRLPGDLNLAQIPRNRAIVFVDSESDVQSILPFSRWPIVALNATSSGYRPRR